MESCGIGIGSFQLPTLITVVGQRTMAGTPPKRSLLSCKIFSWRISTRTRGALHSEVRGRKPKTSEAAKPRLFPSVSFGASPKDLTLGSEAKACQGCFPRQRSQHMFRGFLLSVSRLGLQGRNTAGHAANRGSRGSRGSRGTPHLWSKFLHQQIDTLVFPRC